MEGNLFFGNILPIQFWYYFLLFFIGFLIKYSFRANKSLNSENHTPKVWSWKYWIKNNWKLLYRFPLIAYVLVRFPNEVIKAMGYTASISEYTATGFIYIIGGVFYDVIIAYLGKKMYFKNE